MECTPTFWEAAGGATVVMFAIAVFWVGLVWALDKVIK